jgi:sugar phosphate isomerase/epimerase
MNPISRRKFMIASSSAVAAASMAGIASAADKPRYQLGIQMYSLRGFDLDTALQHAEALGFDQVEFYKGMLATDASDDEIDATRAKVMDRGMSISAHGVNKFTKDAEKNRAIFVFAKKLGISTLTADPDPDSFDSLNDLVQEFDIRIAIHNHGPRHRYNQAIDVLDAIDGRDERIGACADLGHYIRSGQQPTEVIRLLKGRLYGIHLKDFAEMQDKTEGVILGKGHLDVKAVFDGLRMVDFPSDGAISLEYEENPNNPIDDIRQCVSVAKAAMA